MSAFCGFSIGSSPAASARQRASPPPTRQATLVLVRWIPTASCPSLPSGCRLARTCCTGWLTPPTLQSGQCWMHGMRPVGWPLLPSSTTDECSSSTKSTRKAPPSGRFDSEWRRQICRPQPANSCSPLARLCCQVSWRAGRPAISQASRRCGMCRGAPSAPKRRDAFWFRSRSRSRVHVIC